MLGELGQDQEKECPPQWPLTSTSPGAQFTGVPKAEEEVRVQHAYLIQKVG